MRNIRRFSSPTILLAALLVATVAHAQVRLGVEATYGTDYWWRGLMRASSRVVQAGAWAGFETRGLRIATGGWANAELGNGAPGGFAELAGNTPGFSELDGWVEAAAAHELIDARVGLVWYHYRGGGPRARRTRADDTREVYGRVTFPRLWLTPSVTVWHDTRRARGSFIEASLTAPTGLVPLYGNLDLILTGGFSAGQERNAAAPAETFVAAASGLTYVQLAALANLSIGDLAVRLGPRVQYSADSVTRLIGPARQSRVRLWFEAGGGWSLRLGGRR